MKSPQRTSQGLRKYILLQLPSLALVIILLFILNESFGFPLSYVGVGIFIWGVKDAIVYLFVWRAYEATPREAMVGLVGKARDCIDPFGLIEINGELWKAEVAEGYSGIRKGEGVEVLERRGLTLIVKPRDAEAI